MKTIRRRRLILLIGILMTVTGILTGGAFAHAADPGYPSSEDVVAVSVLSTGSTPAMKLTEEDITNISDTLKSSAAFWGDIRGQVSTDMRNVQADIYAVGGSFVQFHPVRMLYGSFLPDDNAPDNAVVLDKGLAWQLFGTLNAIGMTLDFLDKTYTVTGICDTDTSLPGLLSGNGVGRAYIPYDPLGSIPIAGMEAELPGAVAGKNLQTVKNAFSAQGKAAPSFLFTDITERGILDAEVSGVPLATMAAILTIQIIFMAVQIITGMGRGTWRFARERYFREAWKPVLWRITRMLLVCITGAGLAYCLWLLADFRFYLPARYIPGSWIDLDFYKNLIQSEAQAANAARVYLPAPWDIAHDKVMQISGWMNALALAGMAVYALGLRLLKDIREAEPAGKRLKGWKSGGYDLLSIWVDILIAAAASCLIDGILGLQVYMPTGTAVLIGLGLSLWAVKRLYHDEISGLFHRSEKEANAETAEPTEDSQCA